jgi:hypothetical protein
MTRPTVRFHRCVASTVFSSKVNLGLPHHPAPAHCPFHAYRTQAIRSSNQSRSCASVLAVLFPSPRSTQLAAVAPRTAPGVGLLGRLGSTVQWLVESEWNPLRPSQPPARSRFRTSCMARGRDAPPWSVSRPGGPSSLLFSGDSASCCP